MKYVILHYTSYITWGCVVALASTCNGILADTHYYFKNSINIIIPLVWQDTLIQSLKERKFIEIAPSNILISSNYLLLYANKHHSTVHQKRHSVYHVWTYECVLRLTDSCCYVCQLLHKVLNWLLLNTSTKVKAEKLVYLSKHCIYILHLQSALWWCVLNRSKDEAGVQTTLLQVSDQQVCVCVCILLYKSAWQCVST